MFYGIEQSTDSRNQRTRIEKFRSETALRKWMGVNNGGFTYGDPDSARNHHRTFRYGYELDGRIDKKDDIFKDTGTSTYPRTNSDNLATYIRRHGWEVKE